MSPGPRDQAWDDAWDAWDHPEWHGEPARRRTAARCGLLAMGATTAAATAGGAAVGLPVEVAAVAGAAIGVWVGVPLGFGAHRQVAARRQPRPPR